MPPGMNTEETKVILEINNRRLLLITAAISLCPVAVRSQEVTPKLELSGTYSYLREGATPGYTGTNLPKGIGASGVLNINRWLGAELDTSHFSGSQPLLVPFPDGTTEGHSTFHTLMGGPRFSYRRNPKVTPYAHILLGGAGIYSGYSVPPPSNPSPAPSNPAPPPSNPSPAPVSPSPVQPPAPGTPGYPGTPGTPAAPGEPGAPAAPGAPSAGGFERATNMAFAWAVGGGVDVNVNDRFAFRLFQADYLNTRVDGFSGKPVNNFRLSTGVVFRFGSK
jgi:opacity protein-like surface antigen